MPRLTRSPLPSSPHTQILADRYYRVMATGPTSSPLAAQRQADAFKTVALTWLARNQVRAARGPAGLA